MGLLVDKEADARDSRRLAPRLKSAKLRYPAAVEDIDWAGDPSVLLGYIKGRTGPESVALGRRAVRLLEQWLSHSALLRSFAGPRCVVNCGWGSSAKARPGSRPARSIATLYADGRTATSCFAAGQPIGIHRHRIRTTYLSLRDKRAWAGNQRARVDPNHTPAIEGDHYFTATTPAQRQAVEAIVEDAQQDLVRRAHPPVVLGEDGSAALAADMLGTIAGG